MTFFSKTIEYIVEIVYSIFPNHVDIIPFNITTQFQQLLDFMYAFDWLLPVQYLLGLVFAALLLEITFIIVKMIIWIVNLTSRILS